MSILPLSHALSVAYNTFSTTITVQDVTYTTTNGEDVQANAGAEYVINAVVEVQGKTIEFLFGGSASSGSIAITTPEELFIDDVYAPAANRKQSFITYLGTVYRVAQCLDWTIQTGFRVYRAERHIKQQVI